jgi:hypothetical protein
MNSKSSPELERCGSELGQQNSLFHGRVARRVVYRHWLRSAKLACGVNPNCPAKRPQGDRYWLAGYVRKGGKPNVAVITIVEIHPSLVGIAKCRQLAFIAIGSDQDLPPVPTTAYRLLLLEGSVFAAGVVIVLLMVAHGATKIFA